MLIEFSKYQGTGNDFILVDDRAGRLSLNSSTIARLCDRHFGIGADGLIILRTLTGFDFEMLYYNSDGNTSSMCGNGGRCIMAFARSLGIAGSEANFNAADGAHRAIAISETPGIVKLKMSDVSEIRRNDDHLFLDTGSPHVVIFVDDVSKVDVRKLGREIRNSDTYRSNGVNVNFVQVAVNRILVRSYERGVEDETLSCGTGVTASALATDYLGKLPPNDHCKVQTLGGDLRVYFDKSGSAYSNVWLEGEATFVFAGTYTI